MPLVKRHEVIQPLDQSIRLIPLTQGLNTIIDAEDFERVSRFNWSVAWRKKLCYAQGWNPGKGFMLMHREILQVDSQWAIDHINHDTLDNRKKNLRKCLPKQNNQNVRRRITNRSGYKGVCWNASSSMWRVRVAKNLIGYFSDKVIAAQAYDKAALKLFGEFAHLNFPPEPSKQKEQEHSAPAP